MPLTPAQMLVLKNDILVSNAAALQSLITAVDDQSIADWYNVTASPDYWVYRSQLSKAEVLQSTSQDGTTFTYVGNGFITRAVGELTAWQELFSFGGIVNPSLPATRQAFLDIFSGSGNAAQNRTHLAALSRKKVSRVEKLFATGVGSTASPGTMSVEGVIDYLTVARAWHDAGV